MNWEILGSLGDLLGGIGVILSLLYVAWQIRQNTVALKSDAYQRLNDHANQVLITLTANKEFSDFLATTRDSDNLSVADRRRWLAFVTTQFRHYENVLYHHRLKLIDTDRLELLLSPLPLQLASRQWQSAWAELGPMYSRDLAARVESILQAGGIRSETPPAVTSGD